MKKEKEIKIGTIRIGKDCKIYEKTASSWSVSNKKEFPKAIEIIRLFKANKRFVELIDKKDSMFLKGQLSPEGDCQGTRVNILPNGKKLDGAYSIFARSLTIHDQDSHSHWDIIYQNPNGQFAYHYTLEKKKRATNNKFDRVQKFEKVYPTLERKILRNILNKKDYMALPMYTLLKTHMRVGNEIYFKLHKHKGLTTLKKKDVTIVGGFVTFKFIGKDGIPQEITKAFPKEYISKLKNVLERISNHQFVFTNLYGKVLGERDFKNAFKEYTGEDFYPHIVRSYFATKETEDFFNKHKFPTREDIKKFLISVAGELGHKKFSKKDGIWEDNYAVTMGHYIRPSLVEKLRKIMQVKKRA